MLLTVLLLQLHSLSAQYGRVIAPVPPIAASEPRGYDPVSRVREWTRAQRRCERRTNGSCLTAAPDLLVRDVAAKRRR